MTQTLQVPHEVKLSPPGRSGLPRGVWSMAFTELWERYSFYGLQGILAFYLLYSLADGGLAIEPASAAGIVGAYGGAVYLAQVLGAWLGDRLIAPKTMVLIGAFIITAGHIVLSIVPGFLGLGAGLILIVLGTGALKTNITSIVGFIVEGHSQQQRDVSFSYFYMAINIGAVVGPLTTGWMQNEYGFHWGFGLAAIGMAGALVQYLVSMKKLPAHASEINNPLPKSRYPLVALVAVAAVALVIVVTTTGLLRADNLAKTTTTLALIAAAAYFITMCTSKKVTTVERRRLYGYLPLFLFSGIYFGLLFQKFTAISILITERIDLQIGDWTFPVAWITTASPLAAVLITPLIAKLWHKLGDKQPSPVTKFGIGLIQIGCAYLFLLIISTATGNAYIPLALILLFMVIAGSSEVFVGPIGLSVATKIGPKSFRSQMVGLNFLTLALGSSLSGQLGQLFTKIESPQYFMIVSSTGFVLGLLLLIGRKPLGKLLRSGL
ncbi:POT family proton-dependent oligopeptide transporter [Leucobacter exalbidus]|uniref:POT family proton-dependent oligopeptide transporter n=1 Tax=Leucobacter exalbidus TaxID=662960 RepID=A0A940T5C8_9MICO|nr:oligopeptide:H+ symporter [Leucobacter exalbidus]MBP1325861.1 POT family proton-dependent oligopeptide transporter [Leucobacter exalbidus]